MFISGTWGVWSNLLSIDIKEQKEIEKMLCRLVYKDGTRGAWTSNLVYTTACAELVGAEVEYYKK